MHSYLRPTDREAFALTHKDITPYDDGIINLRVTKGKTGFRHSFSTELGLDFYNHLKRINCDYSKLDNFLFLPKWKTGHTQTGHSNECSIMSWKPTISNWIKTGNQGQLIQWGITHCRHALIKVVEKWTFMTWPEMQGHQSINWKDFIWKEWRWVRNKEKTWIDLIQRNNTKQIDYRTTTVIQ